MSIVVDRHQGPPPGEDDIIVMMRADGLAPHAWRNPRGDTSGRTRSRSRPCRPRLLICSSSETRKAGSWSAFEADLGQQESRPTVGW